MLPRRHVARAALAAALAGAALVPPLAAQQEVELQGCYDGDTCRFTGWEESVRLAGIDTPEMDGSCEAAARRAARAVRRVLRSADDIRVDSTGTGYYGRILGRVYADSVYVNRWLVRRGHAVEHGRDTCPPGGASAPSDDPPAPSGPDRDCSDFGTRTEAQRFFERAGGPERDPHRLDGDDDGAACEGLPG